MNELIESYERKIKAIQPMIESAKFDEDTELEIRLTTKASCYRTFISELKQQCNIANVRLSFVDWVEENYPTLKNHGDSLTLSELRMAYKQYTNEA